MNIFFENIWLLAAGLVAVAFVFITMRGLKLNKYRVLMFSMRALIILLLFVVLARPYTLNEFMEEYGQGKIAYINDQTPSMLIRENPKELPTDFEQINVTGNITHLSDDMRAALTSGSSVIVLETDGNEFNSNDLRKVAELAGKIGVPVLSITPNATKSDVQIKEINAQPITAPNVNYTASITVNNIGPEISYTLNVLIDGTQILSKQYMGSQIIEFNYQFTSIGDHEILMSIDADDYFKENNQYYYVVSVLQKPKILLLTTKGQSSLYKQISQVADTEIATSISNLQNYDSLVLDDVSLSSISNVNEIREYLLAGRGMLVVGGPSSYDSGGYYQSEFENLLPVYSSGKPYEKPKHVVVVFVIDVSGSTKVGFGGYSVGDIEKAIAANMIDDLNEDVFFGVVAFHSDAFEILPISKDHSKASAINLISRMVYSGQTNILSGILKAKEMLNLFVGNSYVILLSDGNMNVGSRESLIKQAQIMASRGIKIYTVGVGPETDTSFMKAIASAGNGQYFEPDSYQRLDVIFSPKENQTQTTILETETQDHYITKDLYLSASVSGRNKVSLKDAGLKLVTTKATEPVLTVWYYGLGRVASLTTDNGNEWASEVYATALVPRTLSWVVGDIRKHKDVYLICPETTIDQQAKAFVKVKDENTRIEGNRIDDKTYSVSVFPDSTGFLSLTLAGQRCSIPVNYGLEYKELDVNLDLLQELAELTHGKVYTEEELSNMIEDARAMASETPKKVTRREDLATLFLVASFVLFFIDVVIRRIKEMRTTASKT